MTFPFPSECCYGTLGALAEQLDAPRGYVYPALITLAGLSTQATSTVLGSLYTVLMGPTSSGKGQSTERAIAALGVPSDRILDKTPNSDRGLASILDSSKDNPRPRQVVLLWDEMGKVMQKAMIEGSSLAWELNTLFTKDECGGGDKKGIAAVKNARLSILGNLPISNRDDFALYFGQQTLGGLADRFIFALPERPFGAYTPLEISAAKLRFSTPRIPMEYFHRSSAWVANLPKPEASGWERFC